MVVDCGSRRSIGEQIGISAPGPISAAWLDLRAKPGSAG
jgi:hypothetical protein